MNATLKKVIELAEGWSEQDQEKLAQVALEIEARRSGIYQATEEELRAIDEALAAVERGEIATDEEVQAVFAKFRDS